MTMILRERDYILDELGDPNAPVGSRLWCLWVANEIRKAIDTDDQISQALRDLTTAFKEHQAWQELGCLSWEDFCERYLHRPASRVDLVLDPTARTIAQASNPKPLAEPGAIGNGRRVDNYQLYSPSDAGGTSADYLTARIARDRPDILDRMKRGEYRSVRQAAIDAGIVKPKERYSVPSDDPAAAGRYLAQRVDREWFEAMMDAFYKAIE